MKVKYVPFREDVILFSLSEVADPCVMVFPTLAAANKARRAFQPDWTFQELHCVDMETLKKELIPAPGPYLQDDKRMLCLYAALDPDDREQFHIGSYEDVISWGNQFFHFFEEMRDECISDSILTDAHMQNKLHLLVWQEEHIARLMLIKDRYHSLIQGMGFTDAIFWMGENHIRIPDRASRYVFVNQYYYSGLEIAMIRALESAGNEVLISHQGLEDSFDLESMRSTPPDLTRLDPADHRLRKLEFRISETPDQMVLSLLSDFGDRMDVDTTDQDKKRSQLLVDRDFTAKPYSCYFPRGLFRYSANIPFSHTRPYALLALRIRHLKAIMGTQEGKYLPLAELLNACSVPGFVSSICPQWDTTRHTILLKEIKYLIRNDFLYIDTDLRLSKLLDKAMPHIDELLGRYFAILSDVTRISCIRDIVNLTDNKEGWMLRDLCSVEEQQHPDITTLFYERLANFITLEDLGIVKDWKEVFGCDDTMVGVSLLKLWLDFLAPSTLQHFHEIGHSHQIEVNSLLDTRNLRYDEVYILNAIEGILPSNPEAVWLLNETQRKCLGLKTYELIRDRERYYFLRLILGCESASLCYYNNTDKDIEAGSFVTELLHLHDTGNLPGIVVHIKDCHPPAKLLFDARSINHPVKVTALPDDTISQTGFDTSDPESFFSIPFNPGEDLSRDGNLYSGSYDLDLLTKNPFAWYLKTRGGLSQETLPPQETLTPKFFGTILHRFLMEVLNQLKGRQQGTKRLREVFGNKDALAQVLRGILTSPTYVYCVPQNYNQVFLLSIISECLVESVQRFYSDFLEPLLQRREFDLLPEQETMTDAEKEYRELALFGPDNNQRGVRIHGKVDLRIETSDLNVIIDFKSGRSMDSGQLIFYEYFYYLLDPDYDNTSLKSLFWSILDFKENEDNSNEAKRSKWKDGIVQTLEECLERGFFIAKAAKNRQIMPGITRADIYANQHWRKA